MESKGHPEQTPRVPRHTRERPRWGPRRAMARGPHLATDAAPSPIYSRVMKTLGRSPIFHEKFRRGRHLQSHIGGVLKLFPAPCRRGDHHRRLLHCHACWCLVDGRVFGGGDDDDYFPGNGARKSLDGYELVNPKRKVMM